MTEFLAQLGQRLADRWFTMLAAPGLFLLGALVAAHRLGQAHAVDFGVLQRWLSTLVDGSTSLGAVVFWCAAVLALGVVLGLTAAGLGRLVERLWSAPGRHRPLRWLTAWRAARWSAADGMVTAARTASAAQQGRDAAGLPNELRRATRELDDALTHRAAISLLEPERPTWIGDRMRAVDLRVVRFYDLDLASVWPRLWTVVSEELRADLAAAQTACSDAARLVGWSALYAVLAVRWWPAAVVAVALAVTGWLRARAATGVLADLVETAVDVHAAELAERLGVTVEGTFSADAGGAVTELVRKDRTMDGA